MDDSELAQAVRISRISSPPLRLTVTARATCRTRQPREHMLHERDCASHARDSGAPSCARRRCTSRVAHRSQEPLQLNAEHDRRCHASPLPECTPTGVPTIRGDGSRKLGCTQESWRCDVCATRCVILRCLRSTRLRGLFADAEECWTQMIHALKDVPGLPDPSNRKFIDQFMTGEITRTCVTLFLALVN